MKIRRGMRLLTSEEAERETNSRAKTDANTILRAQQAAANALLAKLAKCVEEPETVKAADAVLRSACDMKDPESGKLLLDAWTALVGGGFIRTVKGQYEYDWVGGDQADLKRLLGIFGFRKWTALANHVLVRGKEINVHSITSQQPSAGTNSDTWNSIVFFLEERGILPSCP